MSSTCITRADTLIESHLSLVFSGFVFMRGGLSYWRGYPSRAVTLAVYTAISRKVVGKMCTRQSRKVIWDMFNTLFLPTVAFCAFL